MASFLRMLEQNQDNLFLDQHSWYAGPLDVKSARENLERLPVGKILLHFVAFFHVASLLSTGVDNEKVGVDNEKALDLDNRITFSYFSLILI